MAPLGFCSTPRGTVTITERALKVDTVCLVVAWVVREDTLTAPPPPYPDVSMSNTMERSTREKFPAYVATSREYREVSSWSMPSWNTTSLPPKAVSLLYCWALSWAASAPYTCSISVATAKLTRRMSVGLSPRLPCTASMALDRATSVVRAAMYEAKEAGTLVNREVRAAEEVVLRGWGARP